MNWTAAVPGRPDRLGEKGVSHAGAGSGFAVAARVPRRTAAVHGPRGTVAVQWAVRRAGGRFHRRPAEWVKETFVHAVCCRRP